ncbi:MAG TPA: hypothetical protein EYQ46_13145 [Myxococcales bacterium]|nr:hypothetical protein [Myxococcales bacterium]
MHKFLITVVTLSLVGLLSCSSESSGGSAAPGINVEGTWEGTITASDEDGNSISDGTFTTSFAYQGSDPSDGSLSNGVTFCRPSTDTDCPFQRTCPEVTAILAGTQRGNDIVANVRGRYGDFLKWKLAVVGTDRIEGTYEFVSSLDDCAGTTGVVTMDRR